MADVPRRYNQSLTDLNSDDFLFQLYHGAELLHDNRVHDAKEAIEGALRLQPRDPKGQNLLGLVYFRLGVYPHAIDIFQELVRDYPTEPAPRINLALCFLKTGQPERARAELEEVTRLDPSRDRAWAYLGLAHERLGNAEKAQQAWVRAGRFSLSKRGQMSTNPPACEVDEDSAEREKKAAQDRKLNEVRRVAEQAFAELEAPSFSFSMAPPSSNLGHWASMRSPGESSPAEELPSPRSAPSESSQPDSVAKGGRASCVAG
jgi:predicted Zn-dependent protease